MQLENARGIVEVSIEFSAKRGIIIYGEYENGDEWEIITLTPEGTFIRHAYVGEGFFKLDKQDRIVEEEEDL